MHKTSLGISLGVVSHQQPREEPPERPLLSATDVIASGFAGFTVAALSSKLGLGGTLLGAGIASMFGTASRSIYKGYLNKATTIGGGSLVVRVLAALRWFTFRPRQERRSILRRALIAGVVAFLLGVAVIAFLEVRAHRSFSCLIWHECGVPSIVPAPAQYLLDTDADGLPDEQEALVCRTDPTC
jgi:hypothetical protein